jgi:hypothetical protein
VRGVSLSREGCRGRRYLRTQRWKRSLSCFRLSTSKSMLPCVRGTAVPFPFLLRTYWRMAAREESGDGVIGVKGEAHKWRPCCAQGPRPHALDLPAPSMPTRRRRRSLRAM